MQARAGTMEAQPGSALDSSGLERASEAARADLGPEEGQTQTSIRSGKSVQHYCGDVGVGVTAVVNG